MARMPSSVAKFLSGKRFAVAGVSRDPNQAANAIFRKLRGSGFEVFPVNPNASEVESERCYPNLASVPGVIDGVVIATHPRNALVILRQCGESEVRRVWFHRAFGEGSVSPDAVHECSSWGIGLSDSLGLLVADLDKALDRSIHESPTDEEMLLSGAVEVAQDNPGGARRFDEGSGF